LTICVSEKRETNDLPSSPQQSSAFLRSSRHSSLPYDLVISIWKQSISPMNDARRESDCRPEPPTPTSSAQPRGWQMTRERRARCRHASVKKTRFIGFVEERL